MKHEKNNVMYGLKKATHFSEGLTSLVSGAYVLSLAVSKRNVALKIALGIAGGYLILRSGSRLHSGSFNDDIV
ncbi:hypothetical protein [Algoriphagus aquimarinus]|uniref:Uncharacterized protein n=1 Tax=Algoriphagus aquimarinus TaxID=237018 RepID=A0A1I1A6S6_9BACT|nr:hypothetical protein [Algoriphagus aquimarinus]SFB32268.1 hypothetical protein SAMN04489723_107140 [Algoriphagus aquimarinus]|tara:strand:+ start:46770 stop:46988 length:219 start_codon:yes stop_codon:yes gene_type:complete